MNVIKKFLIISIILAGLVICVLLFSSGYITIGFVAVLIWALTSIIVLHPKAYPFRFMYPGLITFFLFMIIPILFTVYIGFTNLGTGHLLSHSQVKDILLGETYIPDSAGTYRYSLHKKHNGKIHINIRNTDTSKVYNGELDLANNYKLSVRLTTGTTDATEQYISPGKIFKILPILKKYQLTMPDNKEVLKFASSNYLTDIRNRYSKVGENSLKDNISGDIYHPDMYIGNYTNGRENISPGFFINVGFNNFIKLFTNKRIKGPFVKIIFWTLAWALSSVLLTFSLGIFLAVLVNGKKLRGKFLYRILLIIPYSIPFFISVLIFKGLLNKDFGIINEIISSSSVNKINWLGDPLLAKISCLIVNLWLGFPYMFLVTTGILQSIPSSVYEAASLDGAGRLVTFRKITLPLIMSAVAPLLVGSFAFNLNNFVGIYLLTGGGPPMINATTPAGETDILISYTYRLAFEGGQGQDFGMASAIALIIFILIAVLTVINFKLSGMFKENTKGAE